MFLVRVSSVNTDAQIDAPPSGALTVAVDALVKAGAFLAARGWTPATGGNFSQRLDPRFIAITASGVDKGSLAPSDILVYDLAQKGVVGARPASAETALHLERYESDPEVGAVVHVHTLNSTVLSQLLAAEGAIALDGYELLKALTGVRTHEASVRLPILANSQDVDGLAAEARRRLREEPGAPGYLLAGHGLYTWGRDMKATLRHVEALEFMMSCELEKMRRRP